MSQKVAIVSYFLSNTKLSSQFKVTGANKGIGYAIVNKLCLVFDGIIYLTGKSISFLFFL
jgi:hypothetical protein